MTNREFADYLFPDCKEVAYYEEKYPNRNLKEGAMVTRFAPSPTGFVHMGSLFAAFISNQYAKQTGGVFYLRIEDTDQKRMVENGITGIINDLSAFDFDIKEDPIQGGKYGPYIQSERKEIYQAYVKKLIQEGKAYPCFCTEQELQDLRKMQEEKKERIGYYGAYAKYRNVDLEEAKKLIEQKVPYVIRLKSNGNFQNTIVLNDCIKGKVEFPENDMDIVLLKQDGLPTYHLAHVIDDHLMHTTHVIRGDEWVSSYPIHYDLFHTFGFPMPKYAHIAPLTKKENETVRKLSKRYDPECSITYYEKTGIPKEAVKLYLATLMNSNFEEWYSQNPNKTIDDFTFTFEKMAIGGSLFDLQKLESISKIYFSSLKAEEVYEKSLPYMKEYYPDFYHILKQNKEYSIQVFDIERGGERPRKDLSSYSDILKYHGYMFDEFFFHEPYKNVEEHYDTSILKEYLSVYKEESEEEWFQHLKECAEKCGYATNRKEYKLHPEEYKGNLNLFCEIIRVAITGMKDSPNLYYLLKLLGKERIEKRFQSFIERN